MDCRRPATWGRFASPPSRSAASPRTRSPPSDVAGDGACDGDSGGPLLTREPVSGQVVVAGILSRGSEGCNGGDAYLRADRISDWARAMVGEGSPHPIRKDCGGHHGGGPLLLGRRATWCASGALQSDDCGKTGLSCGWRASAPGIVAWAPRTTRAAACRSSARARVNRASSGASVVGSERSDCGACGGTCGVTAAGKLHLFGEGRLQ